MREDNNARGRLDRSAGATMHESASSLLSLSIEILFLPLPPLLAFFPSPLPLLPSDFFLALPYLGASSPSSSDSIFESLLVK